MRVQMSLLVITAKQGLSRHGIQGSTEGLERRGNVY